MNFAHRLLCNSRIWRKLAQTQIVPWALEDINLGADVLEIGPGPGVTTTCLHALVRDLTCVEINTSYAASLACQVAQDGVRVIAGDGAAMPLADESFDAVVCFTMLHHVPSTVLQDRLLSEARRVLRPGGIVAGSDALASGLFRLFHVFERITPVDPEAFPGRLRHAGFHEIHVDVRRRDFRFRARTR